LTKAKKALISGSNLKSESELWVRKCQLQYWQICFSILFNWGYYWLFWLHQSKDTQAPNGFNYLLFSRRKMIQKAA